MGLVMTDLGSLSSETLILLGGIISFNIIIICLTAVYWIYTSSHGPKHTSNSDSRASSYSNRGSPLGRATSSDNVSSSLVNGGRSASPTMPSNGGSSRKKTTKYRIDEESLIESSFEFSPRGRLWSNRASWHLPNAPRDTILDDSYHGNIGLDHILATLRTYSVDPDCGFLPPQDPLQRLPYARFHLWEDLADDLPSLLGARLGQAREPLTQLPVLPTHELASEPELRRAHLLLCLFAHAYVWGGSEPRDVIPEGIARPLCEVSAKLGLPPILSHTDIVLFNWRRLDVGADVCMENLTTLNNFFHGRDESWFYLITVEIEARGAKTIVPLMLATDAIKRYKDKVATQKTLKLLQTNSDSNSSLENEVQCMDSESNNSDNNQGSFPLPPSNSLQSKRHNAPLMGRLTAERVAVYVTGLLFTISESIESMVESLRNMNEGCHPFIFYHRVRPFLSGWKHNPTLPTGVLYEGVSTDRQYYFGGSAAQSPLIPFLDIMLGISHSQSKSGGFLTAMRDYMTRGHREYLVHCEEIANIRQYVIDTLQEADLIVYTSRVDGVEDETKEVPEGGSSETKGESKGKPERVETHTFIGVKGGNTKAESVKYTEDLKVAYNKCVEALKDFRNGHMKLVSDYIIAQQRPKGMDATSTATKDSEDKNGGVADVKKGELQSSAGGKGTGGTDLMKFLKPIRDDCSKGLLGGKGERTLPAKDGDSSPSMNDPVEIEGSSGDEEQSYTKDNALHDDLDVYRSPTLPQNDAKK